MEVKRPLLHKKACWRPSVDFHPPTTSPCALIPQALVSLPPSGSYRMVARTEMPSASTSTVSPLHVNLTQFW